MENRGCVFGTFLDGLGANDIYPFQTSYASEYLTPKICVFSVWATKSPGGEVTQRRDERGRGTGGSASGPQNHQGGERGGERAEEGGGAGGGGGREGGVGEERKSRTFTQGVRKKT